MRVTIGRYEYSLDPKNRLVVPPAYREALLAEGHKSFILARGLERCLLLFTPLQWESTQQTLRDSVKSMKDKSLARAALREFFSGAKEAELDEQGRILIAPDMKEYAGLGKDAVVLGAGSKAEIWDLGRWRGHQAKVASPAFRKLAKGLDY